MNILFFLTPKAEVKCVYEEDTLKEAIDSMNSHNFSTIPIINKATGKYVGTIAQGDVLRDLKHRQDAVPQIEAERPIMQIRRKRDYKPVRASADISELFESAKHQNFVPVVDDTNIFIGIVTRSSIMEYLIRRYKPDPGSPDAS